MIDQALVEAYLETTYRVDAPHGPVPVTHVLSNGRLTSVVTAAGSGYCQWEGLAINRWREDPTRDKFGTYFLVKAETGRAWSAGYQPTLVEPDFYHVAMTEVNVVISRRDGAISTMLTVVVSEEDDAEVRRISLNNLGTEPT